ncbi:uncharacterized protein LOC129594387 [Paramacrobiotus metropolitanus]|uniref:uncharacterized protein LOC129594387 n=1 Tax=Paramacrobiotus metropolitanus TaxID=2943436 RepID=UPI002445D208|nr:uncharacterized protein LOC129594387 [Paramacrobiotus metropolitanus]
MKPNPGETASRARDPLEASPNKCDKKADRSSSDKDSVSCGVEYEVESIVDHRVGNDGEWVFRVKWLHWPEESNTDEPLQHLAGSSEVLSEYLRRHELELKTDKKTNLLSVVKSATSAEKKKDAPMLPKIVPLAESKLQSGDKATKSDDVGQANKKKNPPSLPKTLASKELKAKPGDKAKKSGDGKIQSVASAVSTPVLSKGIPLQRFNKNEFLKPTSNNTKKTSPSPRATKKPASPKKNGKDLPSPKAVNVISLAAPSFQRKIIPLRRESTSVSLSPTPPPVAVQKDSKVTNVQLIRSKAPAKTTKRTTTAVSNDSDDEFDEYTIEDPVLLKRECGLALGLTAEKILGVADLAEKPLRYIVKWEGTNILEPVPGKDLLEEDPQMLMDYFESRLIDKSLCPPGIKRSKR